MTHKLGRTQARRTELSKEESPTFLSLERASKCKFTPSVSIAERSSSPPWSRWCPRARTNSPPTDSHPPLFSARLLCWDWRSPRSRARPCRSRRLAWQRPDRRPHDRRHCSAPPSSLDDAPPHRCSVATSQDSRCTSTTAALPVKRTAVVADAKSVCPPSVWGSSLRSRWRSCERRLLSAAGRRCPRAPSDHRPSSPEERRSGSCPPRSSSSRNNRRASPPATLAPSARRARPGAGWSSRLRRAPPRRRRSSPRGPSTRDRARTCSPPRTGLVSTTTACQSDARRLILGEAFPADTTLLLGSSTRVVRNRAGNLSAATLPRVGFASCRDKTATQRRDLARRLTADFPHWFTGDRQHFPWDEEAPCHRVTLIASMNDHLAFLRRAFSSDAKVSRKNRYRLHTRQTVTLLRGAQSSSHCRAQCKHTTDDDVSEVSCASERRWNVLRFPRARYTEPRRKEEISVSLSYLHRVRVFPARLFALSLSLCSVYPFVRVTMISRERAAAKTRVSQWTWLLPDREEVFYSTDPQVQSRYTINGRVQLYTGAIR